jgi:CMP-N-acetylneuraminic acid synthetase
LESSTAIFLPVRKGSERVLNKNTRPFANFKHGLLELKLNVLIHVEGVNEIIVSTNDAECAKVGHLFSSISNKVRVDNRPDHLASSDTSLSDLIKYVPTITDRKHILWTHVTSPFLETEDYNNAIKFYLEALVNGFDSLMSVVLFKNFLWSKEKNDLVNRINEEKWPRTQDLMDLYEIDSGLFIASKEVLQTRGDRIGSKPILFENDKIKSFDIDWEEDFIIAEAIYEKLFAKSQPK